MVIESTPSGAQVVLGGAVLGNTPYRGSLPRRAGKLGFVVRLSGYEDRTVTVRGDQSISERVTLVARAVAPARIPDRDQSVNPFAR